MGDEDGSAVDRAGIVLDFDVQCHIRTQYSRRRKSNGSDHLIGRKNAVDIVDQIVDVDVVQCACLGYLDRVLADNAGIGDIVHPEVQEYVIRQATARGNGDDSHVVGRNRLFYRAYLLHRSWLHRDNVAARTHAGQADLRGIDRGVAIDRELLPTLKKEVSRARADRNELAGERTGVNGVVIDRSHSEGMLDIVKEVFHACVGGGIGLIQNYRRIQRAAGAVIDSDLKRHIGGEHPAVNEFGIAFDLEIRRGKL